MSPYPRPSAPHHRRRSQSASVLASPRPSRTILEDSWRPSTKRAHPHHPRSPSYHDIEMSCPTHKWDVDVWRRGKRPRRAASPSSISDEDVDVDMNTPVTMGLPQAEACSASMTDSHRSTQFASTSVAFNFFPTSSPPRARHNRSIASSPPRPTSMFEESSDPDVDVGEDVHALHSSAFWELRRSIAEGGEGFVQRMRDWESSRTAAPKRSPDGLRPSPSNLLRRGRAPPLPRISDISGGAPAVAPDLGLDLDLDDDDDDDVEIYAGETSSSVGLALDRDADFTLEPAWSPRKKRARSLGLRNHSSASGASSPLVEDEDARGKRLRRATKTPSLSHTVFSSSSSSLVSVTAPPSGAFTFAASVPTSATREEKAIAAISLALANGAVSVRDYGAVRAAAKDLDLQAGLEVGEMWH